MLNINVELDSCSAKLVNNTKYRLGYLSLQQTLERQLVSQMLESFHIYKSFGTYHLTKLQHLFLGSALLNIRAY